MMGTEWTGPTSRFQLRLSCFISPPEFRGARHVAHNIWGTPHPAAQSQGKGVQ